MLEEVLGLFDKASTLNDTGQEAKITAVKRKINAKVREESHERIIRFIFTF